MPYGFGRGIGAFTPGFYVRRRLGIGGAPGPGGVYSGTMTFSLQGRNFVFRMQGGPPNRGVLVAASNPNAGILNGPFISAGATDSNGNMTYSGPLGIASGVMSWRFQVGVHPIANFSANLDTGQLTSPASQSFTVDTTGDYGGISMPASAGYIGNTPVQSIGPQMATPSTPASILPGGAPTSPVAQAPQSPLMSNGIPPSVGGQQASAGPSPLCLFGDTSGQLDGLPVCTYTAIGIAAAVGLLFYMGSRR